MTLAAACVTGFTPLLQPQLPALAARVARPPAMVDFGTAAQWLADGAVLLPTEGAASAASAAAEAVAEQPGLFETCARHARLSPAIGAHRSSPSSACVLFMSVSARLRRPLPGPPPA